MTYQVTKDGRLEEQAERTGNGSGPRSIAAGQTRPESGTKKALAAGMESIPDMDRVFFEANNNRNRSHANLKPLVWMLGAIFALSSFIWL